MKADIEAIVMKVCPVCWTSSYEPVEDESECDLDHPHDSKYHERCLCCWQQESVLKLDMQKRLLLEETEDVALLGAITAIDLMTKEEFAEFWKGSKNDNN